MAEKLKTDHRGGPCLVLIRSFRLLVPLLLHLKRAFWNAEGFRGHSIADLALSIPFRTTENHGTPCLPLVPGQSPFKEKAFQRDVMWPYLAGPLSKESSLSTLLV